MANISQIKLPSGDTYDIKDNISATSWYGTCSTSASTSAKVVTCEGFTLTAGSIIGILFSTANTVSAPTLNINSTGAVSIRIGNGSPVSTTNVLKWSANTMIYFMYDGTYFRYINSVTSADSYSSRGANTWYGTSSTSATTSAKTSTITNYVLTKGSLVSITFTTANTYVSGTLTLNINSTGAKSISCNNALTSSTNALTWDAGDTLTFMYDGSYYRFIGKGAHKLSEFVNDGDGSSRFATMDDIGQLGGGTITEVKTNAGAHTTIDVTSGKAEFNVPTKTSDLTNDGDGDNPFATTNSIPSGVANHTTGISIANHSTGSVIGVSSSTTSVTGVQSTTTSVRGVKTGTGSTTTASHVKSGSNGSASTWSFSNVTVPIKNTSATSIPNVTAVGSGSFTQGSFTGGSFTQGEFKQGELKMEMDSTDTLQLNITFTKPTHASDSFTPATHGADSHTHTPPTLGTAISLTGVQSSTTTASKASGGNGTAPSWVFENVDVPIVADEDTVVPIKNASATTVPIKDSSATTVVTSATHSITDNGHTHNLTLPL